jgi:hypothetical protein
MENCSGVGYRPAFGVCSGFSADGKNKRIFLSVFAFLKAHSRSYATEKWRKMSHF